MQFTIRVKAYLKRQLRRARRLLATIRSSNFSKLPIVDFNQTALSIDPSLYDNGALYESKRYELSALPLRRGATALYPEYSYSRPAPIILGGKEFETRLSEHYANDQRHFTRGAATKEALIRNAIIFGNAVYVVDQDRVIGVYESCRENDRTALRQINATELKRVEVLSSFVDHVFLGSPGSSNYGHWLTDDLTRLPAPSTGSSTSVYLLTDFGSLMNQRREEMLRLIWQGRRHKVRFIDPHQPMRVPKLRYASRATHHPFLKSPQAIGHLRRVVNTAVLKHQGQPTGRPVYIGRGGRFGRYLTNEDDIKSALVGRGFSVVDPIVDNATVQTTACLNARVVIGVMGAAMTNTLFCAPGSTVIYLAPRGWLEPYFWDLAAVCEHRYIVIFGDSVGEGDPWMLPFSIDLSLLERALQMAENADFTRREIQ